MPHLHELLLLSSSVQDAVQIFLSYPNDGNQVDADHAVDSSSTVSTSHSSLCASFTSVLWIGQEGCGKTFFLDSIRSLSGISVLRPRFPMDFNFSRIGSYEDRWISLFSYAQHMIDSNERCLLLLDDIDVMLDLKDNESLTARGMALFLSLMDEAVALNCDKDSGTITRTTNNIESNIRNNHGHCLLLCTAKASCHDIASRFHKIFRTMGPMAKDARQRLILSCLDPRPINLQQHSNYLQEESLMSSILYTSLGKNAMELSHCCREVLLAEHPSETQYSKYEKNQHRTLLERRLRELEKVLSAKTTLPSLINGSFFQGILDIRVVPHNELILLQDSFPPPLGSQATNSLQSLWNTVILPLCRSDEIRDLLYGGSNDQDCATANISIGKPIRVGALLTGAPGTGKTHLAYHCASLAASNFPSQRLTLLDVRCNSLIHKEMGGSERAVQRLFGAIRAAAPCIVLLDGIETVAPRRQGNATTTTSHGTMDRVLSTFLTEMDGIASDESVETDFQYYNGGMEEESASAGSVAIIGITHNPKWVDPSLCRPGRLDKVITMGTLDVDARMELVARWIHDLEVDFSSSSSLTKLETEQDSSRHGNKEDIARYVAMNSDGMSAAEVISICEEASMECLRERNWDISKDSSSQPPLRHSHFQSAVQKKKGKIIPS